jgi:2-methylcitrate dehydratase PrpD
MPKGLTLDLARWIAGFKAGDLPASARQAIRLLVLDTLGVGLYGLGQPWSEMMLAWARRGVAPGFDRSGLASIWGEKEPSLRPADAALVMGVAAHAFELDDYNAKLHPGAVVIPAALAIGERIQASGTAFETAVAVGYEVMIRTSLALDPNQARLRGWHLTGVAGPLGAAAAGAVLLGLDAEHTAWALGLAATQGSGLFAFNADGAMSKRLHPGRAAHAGVMAAELAALGFSGPAQVLETPDGGFLKTFSDVVHPEALLDGLGQRFVLEETNFKPYSCCGSLHSYIDAALMLRQRHQGPPKPDQLVRAGLAKVVDVQCGFDYRPGTALNAQMSARFSIAAALVDGAALPDQYTEAKMADPTILSLAERMELVHDPALDSIYPGHFVGWVEVEGRGAVPDRAYVLDPSGAPTNPERETALRAKFHVLVRDRLSEAAAARLEAAVGDLGATPPASLAALMAGGRGLV